MEVYDWADNLINASPRYATGFTLLLAAGPYRVSQEVRDQYQARHALIRAFQKTALGIFRAALDGQVHPAVLRWLINETPESIGVGYHRRLEDRHYTLPVFFRTDEVRPGRIAEIQCPGSAWGELQLAFEHAARLGYRLRHPAPADQFAAQLTRYLRAAAIVHHSLDHASAPAGMRYFIEKTRPTVRYWGIDRGVRVADCNFIRHHSVYSVCADLEFLSRLSKMGNGVTYDLPPYILFDQKAPLVLPFWSMTRECFRDEIRDLFPFTTTLQPEGIEMPDGGRVTLEEFSRWPQSRRSYYLKYAGSSVALNWGSRGIYRLRNLGGGACLDFLRKCLSEYEQGHIWLLQKEETQEDEISFLARNGAVRTERMHAKFSGYYGPGGCLGALAWHRRHYKVHGQEETVISCVVAGDEGDLVA